MRSGHFRRRCRVIIACSKAVRRCSAQRRGVSGARRTTGRSVRDIVQDIFAGGASEAAHLGANAPFAPWLFAIAPQTS